jgi:thymidylate synthase (FAD)
MDPTRKIPILDHGYIQLVEHWGSDERIIEAARMSTGKGFLGWGPIHSDECRQDDEDVCTCVDGAKPGDEKLLRYLWENKHATPFEMAGAVIEVQAPIMVFREWHRHRTQGYSEMSARYVPLPSVDYVPTVERLMMSSATNKQAGTARGADELTEDGAEGFRLSLMAMYGMQETLYQKALSMGVPKELARVHLPVGRYSRMRASAVLRNWLAFLTLRSTAKGPGAQWEIRQYADALAGILAELFPRTMGLFMGDSK